MEQSAQRTRIAAYGLIVRDEKILLCRISKELPHWEGQWTLPGGGLNFGEDPEIAMVREVDEETGLRVEATSIAGIDSHHDSNSTPAFHGIRILYNTNILGGTLRNELEGTSDLAAWFSYDELASIKLVDVAKYGVNLAFRKC